MTEEYVKLDGDTLVFCPASLRGHRPEVLLSLGWKPLVQAQYHCDPVTDYYPNPPTYADMGDHVLMDHQPVLMPAAVRAARAESLAAPLRERAKRDIDDKAGQLRVAIASVDIPGQSGTYAEKARQAEAYRADPAAAYPYLEAEATYSGLTVAEVATRISAQRAAWLDRLDATIEGVRAGVKYRLDQAHDPAAVTALRAWALAALDAAAAGAAVPPP